MAKRETYAEKLARIEADYKCNVTDVIAAMSPEERAFHLARADEVSRELRAEFAESDAIRKALKSE